MPNGLTDQLAELGNRMWKWRAEHQPRTRDDIPRLERPVGWLPDHRADTFDVVRMERDAFEKELAAIDPGREVADRVDHRLLRSLLCRAHWELDVLCRWQRQPRFYLDQALGTVFDALLPPNVDDERILEVIRLLESAPDILKHGRINLAGTAVAEFADLAIEELDGVQVRCDSLAAALVQLSPELADQIHAACDVGALALTGYREWLVAERPEMGTWSPVGTEQYEWFLREVAVLPLGVDELLTIGSLELSRAIALERLELNRARLTGTPRPPLPAGAAEQVEREALLEREVRRFYVEQNLLSQPETLRHYRTAPLPRYLEPLLFLGVDDGLPSPTRLDENGVSYVPPPSPDLPYFNAANALDPRAGIIHEGAHYQQLALSWRHPRLVRRHFYDSGPNEGIAFYNEELMLVAGLFEDAPHTRPIIYNFMRLRALRVRVDVGLATGRLSIADAAEYLGTEAGIDPQTAAREAADFAEGPGQAISYQIGKTQILQLIADAGRMRGDLSLQQVHDYLWLNGNVPIALCRRELLGLTDQLERLGVPAVNPEVAAPPAAR